MGRRIAAGVASALLAAGLLAAPPATASYPGENGPFLTSSGLVGPDGTLVWDPAPLYPSYGAFSADGSKIAYSKITGDFLNETYTVRVRTAAGSDTLAASFGTVGGIEKITWSPDGTRLGVGIREDDGSESLYVVRADGSGQPRVLVSGDVGVSPESPDWRPGTNQIGYIRGEDLFTVDADTGVETQRTHECTYDYADASADCGQDDDREIASPSWSPDGSKVLVDVFEDNWASDTGYRSYVGLLTLGQETPAKVIDKPLEDTPGSVGYGFSLPIFSPDGLRMVFRWHANLFDSDDTGRLYVMDLAGGVPEPLAKEYWLTDWQPCPRGVCPTFGIQVATIKLTVLRDTYGINAIAKLTPAHPSLPLKMTLARKVGKTWRTIKSASPRQNIAGVAVKAFARPGPGSCRITAAFAGDSDHGTTSTRKSFSC